MAAPSPQHTPGSPGEAISQIESELRFGEARFALATKRLTVRSQPVKLPWRAVECLNLLVRARGAVVSKEDLQRGIWNGAMVEDSNLAHCVTALRKALDPAPDGQSYIETVARVGYRLAVPVEEEAAEPVPIASPPPAAPPPVRSRRLLHFAAVGLALLAAAGGVASYKNRERQDRADEILEKSRALLRRSNMRDGAEAQALIQEALTLIPGYAPAQAAAAEASARLGKASFDVSIELARSAVRNDPGCGECRAVLGYVLGTRGWKWDEAATHLASAVESNPNQLYWRLWYAELLAVQGKLDAALAQAEAAAKLAPAAPRVYSTLAYIRFFLGDYHGALAQTEKAIALDRRFQPGHYWAYRSHLALGDDHSAIVSRALEVTSWAAQGPNEEETFRERALANFQKDGRSGVARGWIHEVREGTPLAVHRYNRAFWFMWIGEHDNALTELEAAVKSRPYALIYVAVDPAFAPIRNHPRFQEVSRKVGLVPPRS